MPQYQVDVRILDVNENDALGARLAVESKLRSAGFDKWRVVAVHPAVSAGSPFSPASDLPTRVRSLRSSGRTGTALLIAAILAWVLWFLWVLTS